MGKKVEQLSVSQLLQTDKYLVPLYQRNYAWKREQVMQLLQDIKNSKASTPYYLGTQVVFPRKGCFEIIDGQQRHTTLLIANAVFKRLGHASALQNRNLFFEARENSEQVLDALLKDKHSYAAAKEKPVADIEQLNILNAIQYVEDFMNVEGSFQAEEEKRNFIDRFYQQVFLFRAELPEQTDVNHYFEIMNNRGEQLEKHEILKASFLNKIGSVTGRKIFSTIWDACSQMNSHVQMNFDADIRSKIFTDENEYVPGFETFSNLFAAENEQAVAVIGKSDQNSLLSIIEEHSLPADFNQKSGSEAKEKYSSIIDFSNFLLQVLRVEKLGVRLDDKFLLDEFGYPVVEPNPMEFIFKLLRFRILFDRFVVKQEYDNNDWSWSLKKYDIPTGFIKTTFDEEDNRRKVRMIQSMLHVTFTAQNYKNWLADLFSHLMKEDMQKLTSHELLNIHEQYCKQYYKGFESEQLFSAGLTTPRFLFNYLDYILWVSYYESKDLQEDSLINCILLKGDRDKFYKFRFVQRSSIEHLFPQSRKEELKGVTGKEKDDILNCFGNLCLISRISNSAYNNDLPAQKRHDSSGRNESLKQAVMFSSFNGENWNTDEILLHHEEMIALINSYIAK